MINFEKWLTAAVFLTGLLFIFKRLYPDKKASNFEWVETISGFFPVLLFFLLFRSFVIEPYRIPSSSAEPDLLVGDFILVDKFRYGPKLPVVRTQLFPVMSPQRGDFAVFLPTNGTPMYLIKQIVGLPGEKIGYRNKTLYIGDPEQEVTQKDIALFKEYDAAGRAWNMRLKYEDLLGVGHYIFIRDRIPTERDFALTVPQTEYFMLGSNRDNSHDSRYWVKKTVPEKHLVGRAFLVFFSWDAQNHRIRWERIGKRLYQKIEAPKDAASLAE
jgi:signal peptidase I